MDDVSTHGRNYAGHDEAINQQENEAESLPCIEEHDSRPSRKRPRGQTEQQEPQQQQQAGEPWLPELSLQVRWTSVTGRSKVIQLPLNCMARWDCATGLHKQLLARVFSEAERPPSLTCTDYLQFHTSEECLNHPLDIASTSYRLVADHEGWQYVIHESTPRSGMVPAAPEFLHVVSIEFETVARVIGHLGIRMSMIAYPVVAINKVKLQEVVTQMRTDPEFKGIL